MFVTEWDEECNMDMLCRLIVMDDDEGDPEYPRQNHRFFAITASPKSKYVCAR